MWSVQEVLLVVLAVINTCAAMAASLHAVLNKRDARAAIGWVGVVWLSPFAGWILYMALGVNRIERKAVALPLLDRWHHARYVSLAAAGLTQQHQLIQCYPTLADLSVLMRRLTDRPECPGTAVRPLIDGDQAFPAMLAAIDRAERSVALLSYIFDNDRVGGTFLEHLVQAQARGVEVRVLVDDVGARYSRPTIIKSLCAAGLTARSFLPTRVPRMFKYANLRNHRKILVVDGCMGFTGGTNIREGHWLDLQPKSPVRCLHFCFEGPVVEHLQEAFAIDWAFATGESLEGDRWFPEIARRGDIWARGISDGPDEDLDKMPMAILGAVNAARQSVSVVTPYFLPDQPLMQALIAAALRGVDVRILLPARNNIPLVHWAACHSLPYLLQRGCRVFLSPPPFDHTKLLLVDNIWSLVGSTNWDPRSLRLNFEFNVECYSEALGSSLAAIFSQRIAVARELTACELQGRSLPVRIRDGCARLFSPYL